MDVLTAIDNRLAAEVAILDQLRKSKGILTDLLLSGRIRVPVAGSETVTANLIDAVQRAVADTRSSRGSEG